MKNILLLFLVFTIFSCQKKHELDNTKVSNVKLPPPPKVIDEKNLIGFSCYYSGRKSKPVKEITEILKSKNYFTLKVKLYDVSSAEK